MYVYKVEDIELQQGSYAVTKWKLFQEDHGVRIDVAATVAVMYFILVP
jgi:hypothetical protein